MDIYIYAYVHACINTVLVRWADRQMDGQMDYDFRLVLAI